MGLDDYESQITEIIDLLSRFRIIIDSHVTAIFVIDYFSEIPDSWYESLENFTFRELLEIDKNIHKITCPEAQKFFEQCFRLSPNYPVYDKEVELSRVESYGMNPKKSHEAPRFVAYIKEKAEELGVRKVIDIGSGQGYLSHLLVTKAGLKVTAIEGSEHNTHESNKRSQIINKKLGVEGEYETISRIVTEDNISEFTQEPCFLVGLHTCGDLAPICLKLFKKDPNIKGVFNIGCCYHHITEYVNIQVKPMLDDYLRRIQESYKGRDLDETVFASQENAGFPLSTTVRNQISHFFLGRLPRTLAISEPNSFHFKDPGLTFRKFQFRAAFQVLLHENFPEFNAVYSVGNRVKNFKCFAGYALEAFSKLKINNLMSFEDIEEFYERNFKKYEKKSAIFWVIRSALSGPIENLILLDRSIYLAEIGSRTEMLSIFNKLISPRNVVIAGFRD